MKPRILGDTWRGFDFGCLPVAMAVGDFDFASELSAASVLGVAYGQEWSDELGFPVPSITLIANHGDALRRAFEIFNSWKESTDADSLELTLVLRTDGSYIVCISPEAMRLQRRCFKFARTFLVLAMTNTWFKPISSTNPALHDLRKYCSQQVAPFILNGASCKSQHDILSMKIQAIPGLEPLLKFQLCFVDEGAVESSTIGAMALRTNSAKQTMRPKGRPKSSPSEIELQRIKTLRCHFPVTLERMRVSPSVPDLILELVRDGIRPWQVEQALCNLSLANQPRDNPPPGTRNRTARRTKFIDALGNRFELANGGDSPKFTSDQVRAQILADGNALLQGVGRTTVGKLPKLLAALQSAKLLDAKTAAVAEPSLSDTT